MSSNLPSEEDEDVDVVSVDPDPLIEDLEALLPSSESATEAAVPCTIVLMPNATLTVA